MEEEEEEMKMEELSSVSVSSHQLLDQLVYPLMMMECSSRRLWML